MKPTTRILLGRFTLASLLVLCSSVSPLPVWAEESASSLLMRMSDAFAKQDYDGHFTFYAGDELAALRVVHKVVDGEQKERLIHLNGAPREILRHGDEVVCIVMPGDDIAVLEQSIPEGPFARAFVRQFDRLADTYSVQNMGEGRVANRQAVRIAIAPRDEHRYGFRLWLDRETALLLRSEMIDSSGNKLEVFQFSQVIIGDDVSDEALEAVTEPQGSMVSHLTLHKDDSENTATQKPEDKWQVNWLPQGFKMAMENVRQQSASKSVKSMMYSDGLATFSIFLEPMPERGAASMASTSGATVVITRGVALEAGEIDTLSHQYYLATLVGEIPQITGQRIIESLAGL